MNKILRIIDLSKTYHSLNGEIKAIDNLNIDVYLNEWLTIIGPSGCGKSTLLSILDNIDNDYKGKIIKDKSIKIGYMLQNDSLFPWLSVYQNALLGLKINNLLTTDNINYVKYLLNEYGLGEFINKYPNELSGGMKKRVSLIRCLSLKPDILLLDEAFSSLDISIKEKVMNDIYNIIKKEKKTVIMVTHDILEAIKLSNRIITLSKRPCHVKNIYNITDRDINKYYYKIIGDLNE